MATTANDFNIWQAKQIDVAKNRAERTFFGHINRMSKQLKYLLADTSRIDIMSKAEVDKLIQQAVSIQSTRYEDAIVDFTADSARLAEYAATSERLGLAMKVSAKDVAAVAARTPIAANGLLFNEHLDTLVAYNNKRLADLLRQNWALKTDINDISALIVGTDKIRKADGLMFKSKLTAKAAIDTSVHHFGQVAKGETWKANSVYKYRISSTLDNRTSTYCQSVDGQVFNYGDKNSLVPPFHYYCRTVIIPEIDDDFSFLTEGRTRTSLYGNVDANITYKEWAEQNKDQIAKDNQAAKELAAKRRKRARNKTK